MPKRSVNGGGLLGCFGNAKTKSPCQGQTAPSSKKTAATPKQRTSTAYDKLREGEQEIHRREYEAAKARYLKARTVQRNMVIKKEMMDMPSVIDARSRKQILGMVLDNYDKQTQRHLMKLQSIANIGGSSQKRK
jgi:hypothetical protein